MSFDLCQVKTASKPYFIENISTYIYSIEELCFYLYNNMYLIDQSIVNEDLCVWVRDELDLKRLYRQLHDQLEKNDGTAAFILPIFREIGYLSADEQRAYQEEMNRLEVQPGETKAKLKADYLVRCGMHSNAIREYYQILQRQGPGSLGAQFYSQIWNNLGCAMAGMFEFQKAGDCFYEAWKLVRTREMLRKYVSVLPLYLTDAQYRDRLKELGADRELTGRIQEYNLSIAREAKEASREKIERAASPGMLLSQIKEEYCRSAGA